MPQMTVRRIREQTMGTTPAGDMTEESYASFAPESPLKLGTPTNVNANRQRRGNPAERVEVSASGSADLDLHGHLLEIEEVMCNAFTGPVEVTGSDISVVAAGNKLVKPGGWGSISGFGFLMVEGLVLNGPRFLIMHSSVDGDDLVVPATWMALVDEAAGPSVKVYRSRDLLPGDLRLTSTAELWNPQSGRANINRGLTTTKYTLKGSSGTMTVDFSYVGGRAEERQSAQLANGTAAVEVSEPASMEAHFCDPDNLPDSQLGLRVGGSQLADARIEEFELTVENPVKATYGSGPGGAGINPSNTVLENEITVVVRIKLYRDGGTDVEDLLDMAADPNADVDLGFSFGTADGVRYFYMESMSPGDGKSTDGVKSDDEDMAEVMFYGQFKSRGMLHKSDFLTA